MRLKKCLVCVLLTVFLLSSFASCSTQRIEFEPKKAFSLKMDASNENFKISADFICNSYEDIRIYLTEPKELSGFVICTNGDSYTVDVHGIKDTVPCDELEDTSFLNLLVQSIRTFIYTNHQSFVFVGENTVEAELNVSGVFVKAIMSADGYLKNLYVDELGIKCDFSR